MSRCRFRLALASLALAMLAIAGAATSAPRTYGIDEDPVRLGTKALAAGDLARAAARFREAVAAEYKVPWATLGLGDVATREGRVVEAEVLYRDALSARRTEGEAFPEANARLGLVLLREGRAAEAATEFDLALAAKPDLWDALYGRARIALDQGNTAAARDLIAKGAGHKGAADGEDLYHHGLALCRLAEGDLPGAEVEALRAVNLDPGVPEYGELVGRIYEQRGTPALAIQAYEKAMDAPGHSPTAPMLHTLGGLYEREGRWNDARDVYVRAIEADSTYAPALKDLSDVFLLGKQYERAARTYLRYLVLEADDVDALVGLAESYRELGQFANAFDAASRALTTDPARPRARLELVRAGIRTTDPAQRLRAVEAADSLPDSTAWDAGDLVALASCQLDADRTDAARASLQRALALEPDSPDAWYQQGLLEMRASHPDSAAAALRHAAEGRPDSPLVHLNLGIALYQARRLDEAIPAFRAALALRGDLVPGRLLLAQALAAGDSIPAAAAEYEQVLAAEPANAKALRGLAFCRVRTANYRGAVESYLAATKAEPGNADGWAGLGNAYLGLSEWEAAGKAFDRARAIDPRNPTLLKGTELLEKSKRAG